MYVGDCEVGHWPNSGDFRLLTMRDFEFERELDGSFDYAKNWTRKDTSGGELTVRVPASLTRSRHRQCSTHGWARALKSLPCSEVDGWFMPATITFAVRGS